MSTGRAAVAGGGGGGGGGGVGVGGEKGKRKKVELLQETIHGLLEENRVKQQQHGEQEGSTIPREQEEEDLLFSSLLSKLNAMEKDADVEEEVDQDLEESGQDAAGLGDIAKDLNKIKRQNMITHILLGTVIVMTAVWQFNEVSFLLAVQKKLSNPFKSVGDMIKSTLKRGGKPMIEASPLPPVGIPDITRNDLPTLVIADDSGNSDS